MRLVLREYLSMLRESGELDVLLPDLLLAMGIDPLTRPGKGMRQYGVDVPAVGPDVAKEGAETLFLFTVKRGNITRSDWDTGPQSVRASLNEILDSYLQRYVRPEHENLPKKIVLVTGGELGQDVESDWTAYVKLNRERYPQYGQIEFAFWGGDALSGLLDRHLFDEFLVPESAQKQIRKTIALADQNEDEPRHYYEFVRELLFDRGLPTGTSAANQRKRRKGLTLLELTLHIVFRWSEEVGNLQPALLASERAVLLCWEWIIRNELTDCAATTDRFARLLDLHGEIGATFAEKLRPHSARRDSLSGYPGQQVEYPLRCFEVVGLLAVATCAFVYRSLREDEGGDQFDRAQDIAGILQGIIQNNPGAWTPTFDGHAIDIGLALLALEQAGPERVSAWWIEQLLLHSLTGARTRRNYPISTDSYEDLVARSVGEGRNFEELLSLSTLFPMLSEWVAWLDLDDLYAAFRTGAQEDLSDTDFQMWFPDAHTEELLYTQNAAQASGATLHSIQLPATTEKMRRHVQQVAERSDPWDFISCLRHGHTIVALIASRHYRCPLIPALWQDVTRAEADTNGSESEAAVEKSA